MKELPAVKSPWIHKKNKEKPQKPPKFSPAFCQHSSDIRTSELTEMRQLTGALKQLPQSWTVCKVH